MSEYRHDLITNRWVILAAGRGKRPSDFARHRRLTAAFDEKCPFCPGHEQLTPPEVYAQRSADSKADSAGWSVRVVPNKFPAVGQENDEAGSDGVLGWRGGSGVHEVIIESVRHDVHFAYHDFIQAMAIMQTLRGRYQHHLAGGKVELVTIFNNHGRSSGASLVHPHFQLIAPTIVPPRLQNQLKYCRDYYDRQGRSVFEAVLEEELSGGVRIAASNERFVALCPFGSANPYEVYVLNRKAMAHFGQMDDENLADCARILQQLLKRLAEGLGNCDYNLAFHTAPRGYAEDDCFSWYIQLCPRLGVSGGFEMATDVYINTVAPEAAAAFYRGE